MLENIIATFLGVLIFLYIFWKRLKEDYSSDIIFTVSFYMLTGVLIGWSLAARFLPDWFFWMSLGGLMCGLGLGSLRYKVRFYESFEAAIIAGLPWLSFIFLKDSVGSRSLTSFLAFLAALVFIYLFYFLDTHYREFTWYKSGKVGFAGLLTFSLLLLSRAATSFFGIDVLSFSGAFEPYVSISAAFICFILLYNLSRKVE